MTQQQALEILKTGANVFLTGAAGSGKTHVLNEYIRVLRERRVSVGITASTGIAATHIGGLTIHSWAGIGIARELSDDAIAQIAEFPRVSKRMRATEVLILDEISMLDANRLDLVDRVARCVRGSFEPFGGIQVVLCGDFFQLPPVADTQGAEPEFAYHAHAWEEADLCVCYLHERFRHEDEEFYAILDAIRNASADEHIRNLLLATADAPHVPTAKLYSHNVNVDRENARKLAELPCAFKTFHMNSYGAKKVAEALTQSCLAPELLELKKGAAVMFVKNNFEEGYVNGTLGTVEGFNEMGWPLVRTRTGNALTAAPMEWGVLNEQGKPIAGIKQVPLRLAWAITIHKSQGMTLDEAQIDLSQAFEPGMGYVALSRVRTYAGLRITGLNDTALRVHTGTLQHDTLFKKESDTVEAEYIRTPREDILRRQSAFLKRIGAGAPKKQKRNALEETRELVLLEHTIAEMARMRDLKEATILSHIEDLKISDPELDIRYLKDAIHPKKFDEIAAAFLQTGRNEKGVYPLAPVMDLLDDAYSYPELRLVRLFLG